MDFCGGSGPQQHPDAEQEKRKLGLEDADSTHSFFFCCPKSQPGEREELADVLCACVLPQLSSGLTQSVMRVMRDREREERLVDQRHKGQMKCAIK